MKKWTSFNAGVILMDDEVRRLTHTCVIYPMKWVDTNKNAHLRRDTEYVPVPSTIRTDSPAGDVDSHSIVCSWCAQAHVSNRSCDFTNGHSQGQEFDRILLFRIPA